MATTDLVRIEPDEIQPFWKRVAIGAPDSCWPWLGGRYRPNPGSEYGYGQVRLRSLGRSTQAHRVAALIVLGPPPASAPFVLHSCDYPPCCNPAHLRYGTQADNIRDAHQKGRGVRGTRQHLARLTDEIVREIRAAAALGTPTMALAKRFDVDRTTVRRVVRGETWRHV